MQPVSVGRALLEERAELSKRPIDPCRVSAVDCDAALVHLLRHTKEALQNPRAAKIEGDNDGVQRSEAGLVQMKKPGIEQYADDLER
jgi:hypothetical protein